MREGEGPIETLRHEHERATELLGFLGELGERIERGERVAPQTVRVGVGLLDAYLHRVHARQFDLDLWPEALEVSGPECAEHLALVRENHRAMRREAHGVLAAASAWAAGDATARGSVAVGLRRLAASDARWNRLEEAHPFPCLTQALGPEARGRVNARLGRHALAKRALEANVERYLGRERAMPSPARLCD